MESLWRSEVCMETNAMVFLRLKALSCSSQGTSGTICMDFQPSQDIVNEMMKRSKWVWQNHAW